MRLIGLECLLGIPEKAAEHWARENVELSGATLRLNYELLQRSCGFLGVAQDLSGCYQQV